MWNVLRVKNSKFLWQQLVQPAAMSRRFLTFLVLLCVGMGFLTYWAFSQQDIQALHPRSIQIILNIDQAVLFFIFIFVARRLVYLWVMRRRGAAGAALHTRLVVLFSILTVFPAIIMGLLMVLFFHAGVASWFDDKVKTAVLESRAVADAYLAEHKNVIRVTTDAMARTIEQLITFTEKQHGLVGMDLQDNEQLPSPLLEAVNNFLDHQERLLGLTEALIFDASSSQILARSKLTFALNFQKLSFKDIREASTDVVIHMSPNDHRVRALTAVDARRGLYLLVGRPLDRQILNKISQTKTAVAVYEDMEKELDALAIQLTVVFGLMTLLLLMGAILMGLFSANKLAEPISALILAAEKVSHGNLKTQVSVTNDWEMGRLSDTFNKMILRLDTQQRSLIRKNYILDQRRQFFEAVLGGVASGVIHLDPHGHVRVINQAASEILDIKNVQKSLDQPITKVFPESTNAYQTYVATQNLRTFPVQIPVIRKQHPITLMLRLTVVGQKKVEGYVMTFENITDLVRAQRQAAWENVARRVAHEIKNPLTPIQLAAERLSKKFLPQITEQSSLFEKCIATITRQVTHMGNMVTEFSNFARLPAPRFQNIDLVKLVQDNIVFFEQAHRQIVFKLKAPAALPFHGDPEQISQVLTNLCKNSVEAMHAQKEPRCIWITLRQTAQHVIFVLEDTGSGFPTKNLSDLTEPYMTHKKEGTGLGLAIVQKIVEDHKGYLKLENGSHGARTSLYFQHIGLYAK